MSLLREHADRIREDAEFAWKELLLSHSRGDLTERLRQHDNHDSRLAVINKFIKDGRGIDKNGLITHKLLEFWINCFLECSCSEKYLEHVDEYLSLSSPIAARNIFRLPSLKNTRYTIRVPRNELELNPFVDLSDAEVDIASTHKYLKGDGRKDLYLEWYKRRPDTFMVLDKTDNNGNRVPVAVSIILPLNEEGYFGVRNGALRVVDESNPDHVKSDLNTYISPISDKSHHFLLDTAIVRKRRGFRSKRFFIREDTDDWSKVLIYSHFGILLPKRVSELHILIEPDYQSVELYCRIFGNQIGKRKLWEFSYPTSNIRTELFFIRFIASLYAVQEQVIIY